MNNVIVYCEVVGQTLAEVSLELLTKGRSLSQELGCALEAVVVGHRLGWAEELTASYGVQRLYVADSEELGHYFSIPYAKVLCDLFHQTQPQIALFGATVQGRDLAPRVSSALHSGLTADCTSLAIGDHRDAATKKEYHNLLYQIRPAFGGNIIATIVNPEHRPQMATVREGVMRQERLAGPVPIKVVNWPVSELLRPEDLLVKLIREEREEHSVNIKGAPIIVSGGYGMGSKEGFEQLYELAHLLGGEVGASRAAVDAGFAEHDRQVGQTGVTVRPKLYIACGISGQVQHTAGMKESSVIIAINDDPEAPIHQIADYSIIGDVHEVIGHFIDSYKHHSR